MLSKKNQKLIQQAYDIGYEHGVAAGKDERHAEIIHMLTKKLDGTDWLQEDPLQIRDIVPLVSGKRSTQNADDSWRNPSEIHTH